MLQKMMVEASNNAVRTTQEFHRSVRRPLRGRRLGGETGEVSGETNGAATSQKLGGISRYAFAVVNWLWRNTEVTYFLI